MDVITFFKTDNHVAHLRHSRPSRPSGAVVAPAAPSAVPTFSSLREIPAAASFPAFFVLLAALSISLTPALQARFGFYRLDRISFPEDPRAETAMRLLATPEPDATLLAEANTAALPLAIQTVSLSPYKVRSGDSVSRIAARFGLRNIGSILSANDLSNARRIRTGQTLQIPSMDGIYHTVARGESLALIAAKYSVPVNALLDANDLADSTLVAGRRLFVPGATLSTYDLRRALGELFIYPIRGRLTSSFGYRSDPFTGVRSFHTGIDLAAPTGTSIKATLDGKVATTGYSTVYGNYVILTHDDGYQSLYGHMSKIGVTKGQSVSQGSIIGKVGNTGYSTGSHVHFSMYKKGKMVDPLSMLK